MKRWMQCGNIVGYENDFGRARRPGAPMIADGPAVRPYHLDYATCIRKTRPY
jgi:hypothetical protein